MGAQLQAHLVPSMHEHVRMVVGPLGRRGDAIDEGDRVSEIRELVLAHDGLALAAPTATRKALLDLLFAQSGHRSIGSSRSQLNRARLLRGDAGRLCAADTSAPH